jgi:DNA (cytosine-5)-methyltransferase 1
MTPRAYYNEVDAYAAQWLRNLIAAGLITAGDVDTRSILDVRPSDVAGYTRCHWFAGIGVWDYALGLAGWPADRPVWTGSCPCQPFSAAGGRAGFADERHLWPSWHHLIRECGPGEVFGEQVASKDGLAWLDLVQADLEGSGYAFWAADLCAAGVGAPHIRQRSWFVADASRIGGRPGLRDQGTGRERGIQPRDGGFVRILGDAEGVGRQGRQSLQGSIARRFDAGAGATRELADTDSERRDGQPARLWRPGSGGRYAPDHLEAAGRGEARELAYADGRDTGAERQQRLGLLRVQRQVDAQVGQRHPAQRRRQAAHLGVAESGPVLGSGGGLAHSWVDEERS